MERKQTWRKAAGRFLGLRQDLTLQSDDFDATSSVTFANFYVNPCAQKAFPLPLYPCPEIKTILGRTLVFHFSFPLGRSPLCRALPPIRATAFDILKLAGSSSHLRGPLPRRFPRTIFFDRCFMRSFV
jgi:hypothetical protein